MNAHGLGQSFEQKVGNYIIDVGYDSLNKAIPDGEAVRFDFNLWAENKTDIVDFNHVWVRITPKEKGLDFAGFLYRPEFLLTGMSYKFQKAGMYELTVRFLDKEDKNLAEAIFPFEVVSGKSNFSFNSVEVVLGAIMGLIVGAGTIHLINKNKGISQV